MFYTIECRIIGRLGGILSVWLYVGIQARLLLLGVAKLANAVEIHGRNHSAKQIFWRNEARNLTF